MERAFKCVSHLLKVVDVHDASNHPLIEPASPHRSVPLGFAVWIIVEVASDLVHQVRRLSILVREDSSFNYSMIRGSAFASQYPIVQPSTHGLRKVRLGSRG